MKNRSRKVLGWFFGTLAACVLILVSGLIIVAVCGSKERREVMQDVRLDDQFFNEAIG